MAMDKREFLDLCAAEALGMLDGRDRVRFRRALESADAEMLAAWNRALATAADIALAAPQAPLSPRVLDGLMERVRAAPASRSRAAAGNTRIAWMISFRFAAPVVSALVLAAFVLLGYVASLRGAAGETRAALAESGVRIRALEDSLSQREAMLEVLRSSQMQVVVMGGQEADPAGYGKIIWDPVHKRAILHVSNLPPQPPDKDYQLWVIRDKVPVDAGVFQVRGGGKDGELFKIERLVEADRSRISAFAVTLEPKGGLPRPSGKTYLLGSI